MRPANASSAGRAAAEHGGIATDHEGQLALLRADGAAGQGSLQIAGPGLGNACVLGPLHLRVDRRGVHDQLLGPEAGHRRVDDADDLGGVRDAEDRDLARCHHLARSGAFPSTEAHRLLDRRPAAGGDDHVVARLDEVPSHGQPHRTQSDEPDSHHVLLGRLTVPVALRTVSPAMTTAGGTPTPRRRP